MLIHTVNITYSSWFSRIRGDFDGHYSIHHSNILVIASNLWKPIYNGMIWTQYLKNKTQLKTIQTYHKIMNYCAYDIQFPTYFHVPLNRVNNITNNISVFKNETNLDLQKRIQRISTLSQSHNYNAYILF